MGGERRVVRVWWERARLLGLLPKLVDLRVRLRRRMRTHAYMSFAENNNEPGLAPSGRRVALNPRRIDMQVGTFHFPTDYGIDVGELARELEARHFESLFVCEHTHIPVSRRTPFPSGGELPRRYSHTHDPFVALSFAAAATRTLKLGTGVALLPQRDPIITAKSVASLDHLSGGRFIFAVGGGWNLAYPVCCQ